MAGMFESLLAVADASVDAVFAEAFAFAPMRAVANGKPTTDSNRSAIAAVTAVFDDQGLALVIPGAMPDRASSGPTISILASELPQGARRYDRFTRADGGKVYEVRDQHPDGLGRIVLAVAEL